jgi:hypothetical protein
MIKSTKMSNLFIVAAQALMPVPPSALNPAILAPRPGPKPKPLAKRRSLHALQLAHNDLSPITTTADGLLTQFKYNAPTELDSDSDNSHDIRRRSYTREQKLAAIGYATTKRVWDMKKEQMVPISHKQFSHGTAFLPHMDQCYCL